MFKRSPAATPDTGSTVAEKHSGTDHTDLEKRADGRWSVRTRPENLDTDAKTPRRETCCGFLTARFGVLLFTVLALITAVVFMGITGANIAQNGKSMRHVDFLVGATSLSLWAFLSATCVFGLYATWRGCLKLFTAFWSAFSFHWVLDLVSTIVFLVVAYQRDVIHPSNETCSKHGLEPGCTVPASLILIVVTVGLCLFKVIAAYALYVMYKYRLVLLSGSRYTSSSPIQTKSSPKRLSPFKSKSKASLKSARQGRPWPPTNIPTIKIDFASDQSAPSTYSNGSSGTSSAGFAVFEFKTKYPSLWTTPLDPIGENLKAALARERRKDEEREMEREEADLGLVKGRNASGKEEMVEVPTLSKY